MRWVTFIIVTLNASSAAAQLDPSDPFAGSTFSVTWTLPGASEGRLNCTALGGTCPALASDCAPLNLDSCSEFQMANAREVRFNTEQATLDPLGNADLLIWLEIEDDNEDPEDRCLFNGQSSDLVWPANTLVVGGPLRASAFSFPNDLENYTTADDPVLTTTDLYEFAFGGAAGCTAGSGVTSTTLRICFGVDSVGSTTAGPDGEVEQLEQRGWQRVTIDTVAPGVPDPVNVTELDGALDITVPLPTTADATDVFVYELWMRPAEPDGPDGNPVPCDQWPTMDRCELRAGDLVSRSRPFRVDGLDNGTMYEICAHTIDEVGNTSGNSFVVRAQPRDECDFMECYPGTIKTGHCSAASAGGWGALLVVAGVLRRRRGGEPMKRFAIAAALLVTSIPVPGQAALWTDRKVSSNFAVELRFAPYRPRHSRDWTERNWWNTVYGPGKGEDDSLVDHHPLMTTVEVDWYFYDIVGQAGLSVRAGYWSITGRARLCQDASGGPIDCTPGTVGASVPGNTKTNLGILPISLGLVYRADMFHRWWRVPLIPYIKAGFDYFIWWDKAGGDTTVGPNGDGTGGTAGFHGTLGLALNLDWIEPDSLRGTHSQTRMNGTYLFAEVSQLWGDGFGDNDRFDMTDTLIALGFAVEFF